MRRRVLFAALVAAMLAGGCAFVARVSVDSAGVEGTEWRLPAGLALTPGSEYFARVDAYLTDAKTLQSDYLLFRSGERG